jgi:hypothetical protein
MGPGSTIEHERDLRRPLGRFSGYNASNEL